MSKKQSTAKVSRIMIWPSRVVNLGNYNTVKLNAGVEMEFDKSVSPKSKEVGKALEEARKIVKEEMGLQYAPFKKGGEKN